MKITKEEAIRYCDEYLERHISDIDKEFLEIAKEALQQEPCKDAISRKAVHDGLANIAKAKARSDAQKALMGRIMFFTEQLPPVNPQKPICPSAGVDCEDCPAYEPKTAWIVPIILIDEKGEEHDGLMDMRRMLIYLHNIPAETAISLGYTWKSAEGSDKE